MDRDALEAAMLVASRFLSYAARSRQEIVRRLEREDCPPDVIAAVVDELTARGWLDDDRFAKDWIDDRADRKRYGRGRLAAELKRKGVDAESAAAALETIDPESELQRARAATERRWMPAALRALDADALQSEKRRCADFLRRRGFGWPIITQVLAEWMEN